MSTIAAGTTTGTALVSTGDTTGSLVFQTNTSNTALTLDTSGNAAVTGNLTFNNGQAAVSTGKAIAMAIVFGG
jgi:hypothetical protein